MPRLHYVKKARKDNSAVKKGEPYYWWKFRYSPKRRSKTRPSRSQLTQSEFLGQWYDLEDTMTPDENSVREAMDIVEELLDTCRDSLDNMPEHLQDTSSSGETLNERIEEMEGWLYEAEGTDLEGLSKEALEELIGNMPSF